MKPIACVRSISASLAMTPAMNIVALWPSPASWRSCSVRRAVSGMSLALPPCWMAVPMAVETADMTLLRGPETP